MRRFFLLLMFSLSLGGCGQPLPQPSAPAAVSPSDGIRFLPVGDSYTIGEGVEPDRIWPALLAKRLRAAGFAIRLIENPARTGWTTEDAIERELPVFEAGRPTFSTLLIGVNDWVQGVNAQTFRDRLAFLLDQMLTVLPSKDRLLVLTIPDYSVTPSGKRFGDPETNAAGVRSFNAIVREEAAKRRLAVVNLYDLSLGMGTDLSLVAPDGLHPSAKEHALWADDIFPAAQGLLRR